MGTETIDRNSDQIGEENRGAEHQPSGVEDVASRAAPERSERPEIEGGEQDKGEITIGSPFDSKRSDVYAKARAKRAENEGENEFAIVPPEHEKRFFGENTKTRSDRIAEERAARGEEPGDDQQPKTRVIKVNGKDVTLSDDDLVAHASRALASDGILEGAKATRDETKRLLEEVQALRAAIPAADASTDDGKKRPETAAIPDGVDLDDIVDRIQVGDKEQAKEAMQLYGAQIEERVLQRLGNLDNVVDQRMRAIGENNRAAREVEEALSTFDDIKVNDQPVLHTRPGRAALTQESIVIMRDAMRDAGLEDGFVEQLKTSHGMNELQATRYCYDEMVKLGHVLPTRGKIIADAGESVLKQFGIRRAPKVDPTDVRDVRQERKQDIRSQPRRAQQPSALPATEKTREEARLSAVRKMMQRTGKRR